MMLERLREMIRILDNDAAGLSLDQFALLLEVWAAPGISVQELADRRKAPQSTVSRQLRRLCQGRQASFQKTFGHLEIDAQIQIGGFAMLEQRINPNEPKKRALFLTERGRSLLERVEALDEGMRERIVK